MAKKLKKGDLTYRFPEEGVYIVRLIVSYACINSVFEQTIEIKSQIVTTIIDSLCENKIYSFRGKNIKFLEITKFKIPFQQNVDH